MTGNALLDLVELVEVKFPEVEEFGMIVEVDNSGEYPHGTLYLSFSSNNVERTSLRLGFPVDQCRLEDVIEHAVSAVRQKTFEEERETGEEVKVSEITCPSCGGDGVLWEGYPEKLTGRGEECQRCRGRGKVVHAS